MGCGIDADWRDLLDPFDVELAYMLGAHDRMADACHALLERRIPFAVEKPVCTSVGSN